MNTTEAKIEATEAFLKQAQLLGKSAEPALRIEGSKLEMQLTTKLKKLKQRVAIPAHAAPQKD